MERKRSRRNCAHERWPLPLARDFLWAALALVVAATSGVAWPQDPNAALTANPLLEAVTRFDTSAVQELLERGVSPDAKDAKNRTALFYAAQDGSIDIVRLLLQHGADLAVREKEHGETAADAAARREQVEVVGLLLENDPSHGGSVALAAAWRNNVGLLEAALATNRLSPEDLCYLLEVAEGSGSPQGAERLRRAGATPPPKPVFVLDPKRLPDYVGRYVGWPSSDAMTVSIADGSLQVSFGGPAFKLLAIDDVHFVQDGAVGVRWAFERESSKIVGAASRSISEGEKRYRNGTSAQP